MRHPILEPQKPHDDLSLDQLQHAYCFDTLSDHRRLFVNLVLREIESRPRPRVVLDIGCGAGMGSDTRASQFIEALRPHADRFWGIEPDATVNPPPGLFDRLEHSLLEGSDLPPDSVDVAFSHMVMEHVDRPVPFFAELRRVLKPGGVYLFITPNRRHYFTRTAALLHALRLDEFVLRAVIGASVDKYHYPVRYRCNSEPSIRRIASDNGFAPPIFAYSERWGGEHYFPRPLRFIHTALMHKRRVWKNRRSLLNLICLIRKPLA